jgi:hypothetical protein
MARVEETINAHRILFEKSEGKISFGRRRPRWKDNIKCIFREVGFRCVDLIKVAEGPVSGPCEYGNETSGSIKGGEFIDQFSNYHLLNMDSRLYC